MSRKAFFNRAFLVLLLIFYSSEAVNKNYIPKADFIQTWFCQYWTEENWESHIRKLINAGYNEIIIQGSIEIKPNFIEIYYNSAFFRIEAKRKNLELHDFSTFYEKIFKAIKKINKPFYVSMGLTYQHEWYSNSLINKQYYDTIINYEKNCIREILTSELFNTNRQYISSLYSVYEMYDYIIPEDYEDGTWQITDLERAWGNFLKDTVEYIKTFTNVQIPLFISPFHSAYYKPPYNTEYRIWRNILSIANLREIDAVAPQDHFGFMGSAYVAEEGKTCKDHLKAIKEACKKHSRAQFWINNELFTKDYTTADFDRIKHQFAINEQLKPKKVISFSLSHYGINNDQFYNQYVQHVK